MSFWQHYLQPRSLAEALDALQNAPAPLAILAGGTDLLLDLQHGRHPPLQTLLDITAIPELQALEIRGEYLFIGAARPIAQTISHPLVQTHAQALVEAGALIAGPQVRNVATFGGNVAHALPAADGTIALLALDAQAEVVSSRGKPRVALETLFRGPGESALQPDELIVGFYIPLRRADEASAFRRVMRPQGVALPILNLAVWLRRRDEVISAVRLAVGPAGPVPQRATQTEQLLRDRPWSTETLALGLQALLQEVHFRTSPRRASAAYRYHLLQHLFIETMTLAWERTQTSISGA